MEKDNIIKELRVIFKNDSKITPRLFNYKFLERSIPEIFDSITRARPRNIKLNDLIKNYQIHQLEEPSNQQEENLEIGQRVLTEKEQEEIWIQEYLDRNNFKEIPSFIGSTPINEEAKIVLSRIEKKEKLDAEDGSY
jgi:Ca2+-binding EF-hand superfamily protein